MESLPALPLNGSGLPEQEAAKATCIDGGKSFVASMVAPTADFCATSESIPVNFGTDADYEKDPENPHKTAVFPGFSQERVTGIEPATISLGS